MKRQVFLLLFLALAAVSSQAARAQALSVEKVEPPNWWSGMKWNEVQLMLYGESLNEISARIVGDGPAVTAVHTLPACPAGPEFVDLLGVETRVLDFSSGLTVEPLGIRLLQVEE